MNLADKIKQLANDHGITIAELERNVGISNGQIAKWNTRSPKAENLKKVADYFHVSTDYLLGRKTNDKEVDLADKDALLMYQGKPVSDEDKEMILRLMRGKEED